MAPTERRGEKGLDEPATTKEKVSGNKMQPQGKRRVFKFSRMAYVRSPHQHNCYICGLSGHQEHFCPCNYIYGRCDRYTCRGECPPGQHNITSLAHRKFLRRFVRVTNMPTDFKLLELKKLFSPFGPLLMFDVPSLNNDICQCNSETPMTFAYLVFEKRADGKRAINELNGYDAGGRKLRVDWVYPSCV